MGGDRAIAMVTRARRGRDALSSPSSAELDARMVGSRVRNL